MKVRIIPHERKSAAWHLAVEEALYNSAKEKIAKGEAVQPIVRMYTFDSPTVVLGYRQRMSEIDFDYCQEQNVHVTMRSTGGGSVYLGKKDIQYSLLLPTVYSTNVLKSINSSIQYALQDVGVHPTLSMVDNHPLLRVNTKSFLFDAQRRFQSDRGSVLLHHGTTLMSDEDYDHMPQALKASPSELNHLQNGNQWLYDIHQLREQHMINRYEHHLTMNSSVIVAGLTQTERESAQSLYDTHYSKAKNFSDGQKQFGICYLPHTKYDMNAYTVKE